MKILMFCLVGIVASSVGAMTTTDSTQFYCQIGFFIFITATALLFVTGAAD